MRRDHLLTTAAAVVFAAACASGEAQWSGTVTDSAGIAIVQNTGEPTWSPEEAWTVHEDLRIGSVEDEPEKQFGQVGWIETDSEGRIFVMDAQAQHVKVFSQTGDYLRTMGGPGSGPGEVGAGAMFIAMAAGDTLLVPDMANRRVNRFAPDGTPLESVPFQIERGIPMSWRSTENGLIAEQLRPLNLPNMPATDSLDTIVLIGGSGVPGDTLKRFAGGETINFSSGMPEWNIYSPEPVWNMLTDRRLLFGVNNDYRIGIYAPTGELQRIITMPFVQKAVTEGDRNGVMKFLERAWQDAGVPPSVLARLRGNVHFGEFFPAFANVMPGPGGSIWVQLIQSASELTPEQQESYNLLEDTGAPEWDVFDAEGRFMGRVRMPDRFAPRAFRGSNIYGVWRDDLDVQYVMRLRIVQGMSET